MAHYTNDKPSTSDEECDLLEQLFFKELSPKVKGDAKMSKPKRTYRSRRNNKLSISTQTSNLNSVQNHDNWLGYLVTIFIEETVSYTKECCPGCNDHKNSPPTPRTSAFWSPKKLVMFHPVVRESMLSKMAALVKIYVELFPNPELYNEAVQKLSLKTFGSL